MIATVCVVTKKETNNGGDTHLGEADLIVDNFPGTVYMGQLTGPVHQVPLCAEVLPVGLRHSS